MSKLDSTKALYEVMESENKYTKRITLELYLIKVIFRNYKVISH